MPENCDLCAAARITPWYHECDVCWIAECEMCAVPMAVWRPHGTDPGPTETAHMEAEVQRVAREIYGFESWLDGDRRSIPNHWHTHARPVGGFFGPEFSVPIWKRQAASGEGRTT